MDKEKKEAAPKAGKETGLPAKDIRHYSKASISETFDELKSDKNGLFSEEAQLRLARLGTNTVTERKKQPVILEFLSHFKNPLILLLLIATIISAVFGEIVNATIIAAMVLMSVILDFILEHNAQKAAEKLREVLKIKATVVRDGTEIEIDLEDICVGDIIMLSPGRMVPADSRIISARDFFVNQSALTGESFPVEKTTGPIADPASLTDMTNIVFQGTSVVSGTASAIVVSTGRSTEYGKIAEQLMQQRPPSEFDKGVTHFGYLIMRLTLFLVLFIFLFNSIVRHNILESFIFSVAIAVGLTPELLPVIMSVTMAQGSMRMAKKGVIVKRLPAIPNFGSMDVLCTDKTGTLTEDRISVVKYTDVSGRKSEEILKYAYVNSKYHTGISNPLDDAVLEYKEIDINGWTKLDEIPFDFSRRKMSIVAERNGAAMLITKGAPEEVIRSSSYCMVNGKRKAIDKATRARIIKTYEDLSAQGYRVLAVASRKVAKKEAYTKEDERDLEIRGFISFLDPPKRDVRQVLDELEASGIEMKILTGDNEFVTKKICEEIDIKIKGIMTGAEVDSLSDDALRVKVEGTTIFARFNPEQKNRVILALKANNHVVGFMGDGINDALSLRTADIGISVDSAVDVAKESADIVLTQKSLDSLKEGVLDGRKTYANTMKYIMMGISSNFGNMFSVAVAVMFLPFLPMLPIMIILNNFIYDVSQITIPTDNVDPDFISKPRRFNMEFIKKFMINFGMISTMYDIFTFFLLYAIFKANAPTFQTGWFIESLATQTLVIHFIRTKKTPFLQSNASKWLFVSSFLCVIVGWIIPYTPIGTYFGFTPLPLIVLGAIAFLVIMYFLTVELAKKGFYRYHDL